MKNGIQEVNRNKEPLQKRKKRKRKKKRKKRKKKIKKNKKKPTKTKSWKTQNLRKLGQKRTVEEKKRPKGCDSEREVCNPHSPPLSKINQVSIQYQWDTGTSGTKEASQFYSLPNLELQY